MHAPQSGASCPCACMSKCGSCLHAQHCWGGQSEFQGPCRLLTSSSTCSAFGKVTMPVPEYASQSGGSQPHTLHCLDVHACNQDPSMATIQPSPRTARGREASASPCGADPTARRPRLEALCRAGAAARTRGRQLLAQLHEQEAQVVGAAAIHAAPPEVVVRRGLYQCGGRSGQQHAARAGVRRKLHSAATVCQPWLSLMTSNRFSTPPPKPSQSRELTCSMITHRAGVHKAPISCACPSENKARTSPAAVGMQLRANDHCVFVALQESIESQGAAGAPWRAARPP